MSTIITKGLRSTKLITQGYGTSSTTGMLRDIIQVVFSRNILQATHSRNIINIPKGT